MKKITYCLIFLLLFIPIHIKADYQVNQYRIDLTVLENGDIHVIEAFQMSGQFNGFERKINYKGNYDGYKGAYLSSTKNRNLYNGDGISFKEIRAINFDDEKTMLELQESGDLFHRVNEANKGEYGVYKVTKTETGEIYTIYNPNKMNKDIYLEYTLKNMVVVHKDVAELALTLFTDLEKDIENLEIYIHIPENKKVARFWLHDDIEKHVEVIDIENIKIKLQNVKKDHELDFRLVFHKDVITEGNKKTENIVWNTILDIEKKIENTPLEYKDEKYERMQENAYDLVNKVERTKDNGDYNRALAAVKGLKEDDELQIELIVKLLNIKPQIERNEVFLEVILTSVMGIWFLGLIILFYQFYKKYNHNYEIEFTKKWTKEIPAKYPPFVIGYLLNKEIHNTDLAATILDLDNRKIISIKKIENDYNLKKRKIGSITLEDERLLKLLFQDQNEICLSELKEKTEEKYDVFLSHYSNWLNSVMARVEEENLFETVSFSKAFGIIYTIIGIIIGLFLIGKNTYFPSLNLIIISLLSLLFFLLFYKRTVKGKEEYRKWKALKRYLDKYDGIMLPKIEEFYSYLICSISLGNFEKFVKQIQSKFKENKNFIFYQELIDLSRNMIYFSSHIVHTAYKTKSNIDN